MNHNLQRYEIHDDRGNRCELWITPSGLVAIPTHYLCIGRLSLYGVNAGYLHTKWNSDGHMIDHSLLVLIAEACNFVGQHGSLEGKLETGKWKISGPGRWCRQ